MGAVVTTTYEITCDNPNCPGNDLDPTSHDGWIQMSAIIHQFDGTFPVIPPNNFYCTPSCAGTVDEALTTAIAAHEAAANPPTLDNALPDEDA